jgi:formiminotetrahydrofolate cyclodeaminase
MIRKKFQKKVDDDSEVIKEWTLKYKNPKESEAA